MRHLTYKGYIGTIEFEVEDNYLFGKLAYIRDLVTYQATTIKELEDEFKQSVELYLADCQELNKKPDIPFKGVFNVRVHPDTHRHLAEIAEESGLTINAVVNKALENEISRHAR
ncbi:type II toxin-antitoxin system HicB family antitoxin (plasmid) [Xenorhabdus sp. SF857]|uniref:type II toxin-antitoxin system HicB family antitoxin n=1 Tax=Xenorhabdus bakwenae TaxID=3026967 RepID=UPI0025582728|nr:type II toxin-antitoxin system HicB family antitoxin [Xenorhabdus sp. SF857]WFQ78074.1 type II toxin-antitoxin system HicB family antitoxin [Xenorhabdus sp. SF857]WFQ78081.1 type II toxin-antitoxin system HicB family antitoxin [Xenorhabdus sp. SF857]